jgi:hypothetical protein
MKRLLCTLSVLTVLSSLSLGQSRDGQLFDPGVLMTEPASGAPEELAAMQFIVGQWDVEYRAYRADALFASGNAQSSITSMNRGHAIMER